MNDSGLLCHLRGDVAEGLLTNRMACGNIVENFAIMEVMKLITWHKEALQPYHFSIHKGAEVDLVLEDGRKQLYGIEVKSTVAVNTDDFKGLRKLAEVAGEKFKRGIVLYTGEHVVGGFGNDMLAVPMSALWM
jgi:predicted AAA+ superfamily ATPase